MDKLQSSGALRTRQRSDFAWQPSLLSSDPLPPGNPGANQSVGALGVVESRAWGPPLFVAVANGRIRNISGCPGDSVICHRITFENGTWNEATAAAAPAPGPAAAAAAAHATAPAARRERLCSNEAARPEVGPPARAPFPRPTRCQSLRVPGAWNSGERGGWNAFPWNLGLGSSLRSFARSPLQAEAAAAPSRQPRALTCRHVLGLARRAATSGDQGMYGALWGPPVSSRYTSCLSFAFGDHPAIPSQHSHTRSLYSSPPPVFRCV
jgi:hypothetical protein